MRNRARRLAHLLAGGLLAAIVSAPASAALLTFNTFQKQFLPGVDNQGWWPEIQSMNSDGNTNYITGFVPGPPLLEEYRSFFTFDLSSLKPTGLEIVSATLRLRRFGMSAENGRDVTIQFWDVTTPAATLNHNVGTNATIFADLGGGKMYGQFVVPYDGNPSPESPGGFSILEFTLDAEARSDIGKAAGKFFSVGGKVLSTGTTDNHLFSSSFGGTPSGGDEIQQLVVEVREIPEPETLGLFCLGLLMMVSRIRRTQRKAPA